MKYLVLLFLISCSTIVSPVKKDCYMFSSSDLNINRAGVKLPLVLYVWGFKDKYILLRERDWGGDFTRPVKLENQKTTYGHTGIIWMKKSTFERLIRRDGEASGFSRLGWRYEFVDGKEIIDKTCNPVGSLK